ncbi:hypothetical protein HKK52_06140 [Pseudomonas sp. ADAK2]|uniref:hypothetical protein n=1 Tax=unclassified Pseudomonas TaxID=196821 RepID=UPI0014636C55|nr:MULTISPECIES: hypothetical protein [unclassified Pseudomonas]QJI40513.1 hypothetical protein HKK53_06135 [Pseudomonas sp. ADAK7]QJI46818.1 hypothetical protein HKK52_06140 [Pseudomonas sp. ADAK2]
MEKLQVQTDKGWAFVFCFIGKKLETTDNRDHALPRKCPELAGRILEEFERDFPERKFRLA